MRVLLAGVCAWSAGGVAIAGPVVYRLDPTQTFATFEVMHFGTSTLRGRLGPLDGQVVLDREARSGEVRLTIPMATLDTGSRVLDARLRAPDLLATEAFPDAWFVATSFRYAADGGLAEVRGEFTVRGTSLPLSLLARRFACRDDVRLGREVCGGDFEGRFRRSDVGARFGLPFVGDDVRLVVQVEGVADRPGPAHPPLATPEPR
jgi:polyisoprenoid-binding protein YceI